MASIDPDDELYRRVFHYYVKPDGSISSKAFTTKSGRPDPDCSVYLARITTAQDVLNAGAGGQRLIGFLAKHPMAFGLTVKHDPQPGDPAHCLMEGLKTKEHCSRLAEKAYVVI